MTTLGGRMLWRAGVLLAPLGAGGAPGMELYRSGSWPEGEPMLPSWGGWPETPCSDRLAPALPGGSGLLRRSLSVDVDDDGVSTGDWFESREPADGDEVPSLPSLFFLEPLAESLPRESCDGARDTLARPVGDGSVGEEGISRLTNHLLAEAPHLCSDEIVGCGRERETRLRHTPRVEATRVA